MPRSYLRWWSVRSAEGPRTPTYRGCMVPAARWLVVALLALGVTTPPALLAMLPAHGSDVTADVLARRVQHSTGVGWSGEVHAQGSLDVPLSGSTFGGVARILGQGTDLRVWWRDARHWRVDRIRTTGETDLVRDGGLAIRWDYESATARFTAYSPVRLPDDNDLVPSALAARLLAGARPAELSRLPARRVAGRSAAGLRLAPADPASTIARVEVWADEDTGLPLRVAVYGDRDATHPALSSEVVALRPGTPTDREVGFTIGSGADFHKTPSLDDVAAANAFAPFALPASVAGFRRRATGGDLGAVGVYGRGPTALLALPLRGSVADGLAEQLRHRARTTGAGLSLEVGPLSVLLVRGERANFLLTGTVTPAALRQAAVDLLRGVVRTR